MNRLGLASVVAASLMATVGFIGVARAYTPVGPYVYLGGGAAYLENSQLSSLALSQTFHPGPQPFSSFTHGYGYKNGLAYTGRGEVGYFFNNDSNNHHAFGVEGGFNYFFPTSNGSVTRTLHYQTTGGPASIRVKSTDKVRAWAADLEGVFTQALTSRLSYFLKLGAGYERINEKVTNAVDLANDPSNSGIPATENFDRSGFGVAGGAGFTYALTRNLNWRVQMDALKGGKGIGYVSATTGLGWNFIG
ncbi:MAG: hypothetical protein K0U12_01410 [Gammaproteobacteria bacterium]|nr:hypothetical protein [Gammaproteobacteria bacterium]